MGMEARLFLGPRDGEVLKVVEAMKEIAVMAEPVRKHRASAKDDNPEYTEYIYQRDDEPIKPGVYRYHYVGQKAPESEPEHENPQD